MQYKLQISEILLKRNLQILNFGGELQKKKQKKTTKFCEVCLKF